MNDSLTQLHARQQMTDRLARASAPHVAHEARRRHQLADRLRRVADRLEA